MENNNIIECGGFYFIHNFDSGNLGHVERVPTELIAATVNHKSNTAEIPDYEFNLWTRPDCAGTEFENGNRTWFYFGIQAGEACSLVRLNIINLNKQGKMYNQGMAPVTRTLPGKPHWERIRDKPLHSTDDNTFTLSFRYRTSENVRATTFFAFTYPYSFAELQIALNSIDLKMLPLPPPQSPDDIYYHRESLIYSLEGRRVDLLTISSHHGITSERETRLKNLFPDKQERPFKFQDKKVIFISARVHPGETPSSFVFNGFLNLLLTRHDAIAIHLRKVFVFKMIPFLNPDGVARGHYRTDTRGVNLNRVYLNPSLMYHPTVYASRALIRYYHFGCEKEDNCEDCKSITSRSIPDITESDEIIHTKKRMTPLRSSDYSKRDDKKVPITKTVPRTTSGNKTRQPLQEGLKISNDHTKLTEQDYNKKIQEMTSQTSTVCIVPPDSNTTDETSLLNETMLRDCLGSGVHLSTSEELNFEGSNPLRPLRDTLKNSICLLMESSSSVTGDSVLSKESRLANTRTGWCRQCRTSVNKLENTMPGITNVVPGYSPTMTDAAEVNTTDNNEFFFCTNCFKRYLISELDERTMSTDNVSTTTVAVSAGDSGNVRSGFAVNSDHAANSKGDNLTPLNDDKPKSPVKIKKKVPRAKSPSREHDSGLYLYIDLHGHASKKGIFMYGNYFDDLDSSVECMLLPRIMSLNNLHFHFSSCNFTERNMYLKDRRDGMSREGSGRVAVLKATGLVRSYTLECNYNTGRLVNILPPPVRETQAPVPSTPPVPPKYTPHIFEEVGRSLGASILDLIGQHPNSRIPCSEHRNLAAVKEWLKAHSRSMRPQLTMSRLRPKTSSPTRAPLYVRSKAKVAEVERKENTYVGAKSDSERKRSPPVLGPRSGHDITNMKYVKKSEPTKTPSRTRYLAENEPKPKTLSTKRRNILAIKKPNAVKSRTEGIVKPKVSKRLDESEVPRGSVVSAKLSKRSFSRSFRRDSIISRTENVRSKAMASSSSSDHMISANWEDVAGGTVLGTQTSGQTVSRQESQALSGKRRSFPNPSPSRLKKIRLKTGF